MTQMFVLNNKILKSQAGSHLLLSFSVAGLQLQNLLKAATGRHGISQRKVAFTLTQMTLWVG